jgi:hypothetical protein
VSVESIDPKDEFRPATDARQQEGWDEPHPAATGRDRQTPPVLTAPEEYLYEADQPPDVKFQALGRRLDRFGDLFRHPDLGAGLKLLDRGADPRAVAVQCGTTLLAVIGDRLRISVVADGKPRGGRIPTADLGPMLQSEVFLQQFRPLDRVIDRPLYLPNWEVTPPGYSDGGRGQRYYLTGRAAPPLAGLDAVHQFLSVVPFKTPGDRTNAVAAALTVLLRNRWPGGKPFFPITANRSHAGKGTVAAFIGGPAGASQICYESTDWAFQKAVVSEFHQRPDLAVLTVDNVRLDRRGDVIRSAFLERVLHEPEPNLFSPGSKAVVRIPNHFVVLATVNEGRFSDDLINRSVPIRLEATGDLADRTSPIGDPKGEFLPKNRDRLDQELRGMIARWVAAGRPEDGAARHPSFPEWASAVGGILAANGFSDFLSNLADRRSEDDPVRRALARLGHAFPNEWIASADWAARIAKLGLTGSLVSAADRDTADGRTRGAGVALSNHAGQTLVLESEDERVVMVLEKTRRRFDGGPPQTRYRFVVRDRTPTPIDPTA